MSEAEMKVYCIKLTPTTEVIKVNADEHEAPASGPVIMRLKLKGQVVAEIKHTIDAWWTEEPPYIGIA